MCWYHPREPYSPCGPSASPRAPAAAPLPDTPVVEGKTEKEVSRGEKDVTLEFLHEENVDDPAAVRGGPGSVAIRANMHSRQEGADHIDLPEQTLACYVLR